MNANEMPERIYLFDYNEAMVTPLEGDTVYVREDAFIEKACAWLEPVLKNYAGYYVGEDILGDFRKYMEGE